MAPSPPTVAGYVVFVGRPNAGKSTLLNAMVGEKLSIVSPLAQTTWRTVTGIYTGPRAQIVFLDTPGLLDARDQLQRAMVHAALERVADADAVLVVLDATRAREEMESGRLAEVGRARRGPLFAAVNKIDVAEERDVEALARWAEAELGAHVHRISALLGAGLLKLRDALGAALPESPFLFPAEQIASQPLRFFVAELIRETVFEQFRQEIPYSTLCSIEEYAEDRSPIYIRATLHVERSSQKGILIGERGRAIRELGRVAREKVERLVGEPVFLELWVKVLAGWRRKGSCLRRFGFQLPDDHGRAAR
ncbi:MAG: GTPase Era [Gemmatimonadetes bacterium]|nr:GTPase Era [Gemmatimonadota bacterium]